jgi:hypothetical protein
MTERRVRPRQGALDSEATARLGPGMPDPKRTYTRWTSDEIPRTFFSRPLKLGPLKLKSKPGWCRSPVVLVERERERGASYAFRVLRSGCCVQGAAFRVLRSGCCVQGVRRWVVRGQVRGGSWGGRTKR